jgi:BirA family biotin operon repressor/biotin-[acetyl-CoA-carboxylase] ligase
MPIPQNELIAVLADGCFHSGSALGERWRVSRAAIAKAIGKLTYLGLDVCAVKGKGYRLVDRISLLDAQCILGSVDAKNKSRINQFEIFPTLPSTNSYLLDQVSDHLQLPDSSLNICLAEMQSAGRGSRGRNWISPFGQNVYMSLLREFSVGAQSLGGLSLAIGVGVARVLEKFHIDEVGLKWPNDVFVSKKKAAGILIEIKGDALQICHVVIGIGVNLKLSNEQMTAVQQPWTSLAAHGFNIARRSEFVGELLNSVIEVVDEYERLGFEVFMAEWAQKDLAAGSQLELKVANRTLSGVGRGVDRTGSLLVQIGHSVEAYSNGEVSLRFSNAEG